MKRNLSEIEQRIVMLLRANSRMSITDIARELGTSRVTAKRAFDSLIQSGRIKKFTVILEEDEREMILVQTNDPSKFPDEMTIEKFHLIDNSYIVVLYYEDLTKIKGAHITSVQVAVRREQNDPPVIVEKIHCDYCGNEINSRPIIVQINNRRYYACCPNCERDLKKRSKTLGVEA